MTYYPHHKHYSDKYAAAVNQHIPHLTTSTGDKQLMNFIGSCIYRSTYPWNPDSISLFSPNLISCPEDQRNHSPTSLPTLPLSSPDKSPSLDENPKIITIQIIASTRKSLFLLLYFICYFLYTSLCATPHTLFYSVLSAVTGSLFDAFLDGIKPPINVSTTLNAISTNAGITGNTALTAVVSATE